MGPIFLLLLLLPALMTPPAMAQTFRQVTANDLLANANRYLQQRIELKDVYCYGLEDRGGFECATSEPLIVRATSMTDGAAKTKIEAECGGLDAIERTPNCRFNLRFVLTAVSKEPGEVMIGGRLTSAEITVVAADLVTPVAAR